MRLTAAAVALAVAFVARPDSAAAQDAAKLDITGKWAFTVQTDQGSGTPSVTFKQQGDAGVGSGTFTGKRQKP